jgi:hypothetical protein
MKARPKRKPCDEVRYYGDSRRLKLHIYADGMARLHYRPMRMRSLWTGDKTAWQYVGEFPRDNAEHIAETFVPTVERLAEYIDAERRAECRAN